MATGILGVKGLLPTKREALFFDAILVPNSAKGLAAMVESREVADVSAELSYLMEAGITRLLPDVTPAEPGYAERVAPLLLSLNAFENQAGKANSTRLSLLTPLGQEFHTRVLCAEASLRGLSAVPILSGDPFLVIKGAQPIDVAHVVVRYLPIPSADVPWEQIVDFRADPDARGSLLRLRRWIRGLNNEKLTAAEVHEDLESLLHEYEARMKLHKMKFEYGLLRTVMSFSLDVMENVIKLRLKNALDALYAVQERRVALLEAEMSAPGREVAYIVQARDQFPDQRS